MKTHILTVTQLTVRIKDLLENNFAEVWLEGELSNLSMPQSGHAYFTIKDKQSQIRGVFFKSSLRNTGCM
jgi:exodeoxyribonuclease VII large subunit